MRSNLYFKMDLYAIENDSELRYLCAEHPVWGYSVFIYAVSLLYRNNGLPIDRRILVMDVAHGLFTDNRDKVEEIIDLCVSLGLFKMDEEDKLYSSRVQKECQKQAEFSEKQRGNARKRWGSDIDSDSEPCQDDTTGTPVVMPSQCRGNANKQEQEEDNPLSVSDETSSPLFDGNAENGSASGEVPYEKIKDAWNSICEKSGLPKCLKVSDKRKKSIRAIWAEFGDEVFKAIEKVSESDFLTGRDEKWYGCGFDWLLNKNNMLKVLEGKYNRESTSYGRKGFRPSDITGQYKDIESEVIEL